MKKEWGQTLASATHAALYKAQKKHRQLRIEVTDWILEQEWGQTPARGRWRM